MGVDEGSVAAVPSGLSELLILLSFSPPTGVLGATLSCMVVISELLFSLMMFVLLLAIVAIAIAVPVLIAVIVAFAVAVAFADLIY